MKVKKIPMRSCVVTHERLEKKNLIRVVRTPEEKIVIDETGKVNGHGAYLKKDPEVIEKARKMKILDGILNTEVNDEIYDELKKLC